jgi:hypothetical protein
MQEQALRNILGGSLHPSLRNPLLGCGSSPPSAFDFQLLRPLSPPEDPTELFFPKHPVFFVRESKGCADLSLLTIKDPEHLLTLSTSLDHQEEALACAKELVTALEEKEQEGLLPSLHPLWLKEEVVEEALTVLSSTVSSSSEKVDKAAIFIHLACTMSPYTPPLDYLFILFSKWLVSIQQEGQPFQRLTEMESLPIHHAHFDLWWVDEEEELMIAEREKLKRRQTSQKKKELDLEKEELTLKQVLARELFQAFVFEEEVKEEEEMKEEEEKEEEEEGVREEEEEEEVKEEEKEEKEEEEEEVKGKEEEEEENKQLPQQLFSPMKLLRYLTIQLEGEEEIIRQLLPCGNDAVPSYKLHLLEKGMGMIEEALQKRREEDPEHFHFLVRQVLQTPLDLPLPSFIPITPSSVIQEGDANLIHNFNQNMTKEGRVLPKTRHLSMVRNKEQEEFMIDLEDSWSILF